MPKIGKASMNVNRHCPECGDFDSKIVHVSWTWCNRRVRRRACANCGHRWYTIQEPEELIRGTDLLWDGHAKSLRVSYLGQRGPAVTGGEEGSVDPLVVRT